MTHKVDLSRMASLLRPRLSRLCVVSNSRVSHPWVLRSARRLLTRLSSPRPPKVNSRSLSWSLPLPTVSPLVSPRMLSSILFDMHSTPCSRGSHNTAVEVLLLSSLRSETTRQQRNSSASLTRIPRLAPWSTALPVRTMTTTTTHPY